MGPRGGGTPLPRAEARGGGGGEPTRANWAEPGWRLEETGRLRLSAKSFLM